MLKYMMYDCHTHVYSVIILNYWTIDGMGRGDRNSLSTWIIYRFQIFFFDQWKLAAELNTVSTSKKSWKCFEWIITLGTSVNTITITVIVSLKIQIILHTLFFMYVFSETSAQ